MTWRKREVGRKEQTTGEGTVCAKSLRQEEVRRLGGRGPDVGGLEPSRDQNTHSLGVKVTIFNLTLRYQNTTEVFQAEKAGRGPVPNAFFRKSLSLLCRDCRLYL